MAVRMVRSWRWWCAAVAAAGVAAWASAKPTSDPNEISKVATAFVNFHELKDKDGLLFGSPAVGQPYAKLGLVLPSQQVDANANLGPDLPVAIRNTGVSTINNANYQSLAFTRPQRAVGFTVFSPKATQIIVSALNRNGEVLDTVLLPPSSEPQFVGFLRDEADIAMIRVIAPHATLGDAVDAPTMISGIALSGFSNDEADEQTEPEISLSTTVGALGVGATGRGATVALGNAGFGGGGSGSGVGASFGRNPGNRNPNLPPAIIPEPAALGLLAPAGLLMLRRRRHD
ncbi:MAG: hypothetical protein ACK4PI_02725 [Tepidisphaerales bacterium]